MRYKTLGTDILDTSNYKIIATAKTNELAEEITQKMNSGDEANYDNRLNAVIVAENTQLRARAEQAEAENQALVDDNQILMWRLRKVVEVEVKWRANVATSGMEIYLELLNELRGVLQFAVVKQAALAGQVKP